MAVLSRQSTIGGPWLTAGPQVVDMRWGVRDEMTDEHMTTVFVSTDLSCCFCPSTGPKALCMNELSGCQKYSMGVNFIYFGAQK